MIVVVLVSSFINYTSQYSNVTLCKKIVFHVWRAKLNKMIKKHHTNREQCTAVSISISISLQLVAIAAKTFTYNCATTTKPMTAFFSERQVSVVAGNLLLCLETGDDMLPSQASEALHASLHHHKNILSTKVTNDQKIVSL